MLSEPGAPQLETAQPSFGQADMAHAAEDSTWSSGSSACDVPVLRAAQPGSSTLCSVSSADCTPLSSPFNSQRASTASNYPMPAALASQLEALRSNGSNKQSPTTSEGLAASKQPLPPEVNKHLPLSLSASSSEGGVSGDGPPKEGRRSPALLLRPPDKVFDNLLCPTGALPYLHSMPTLRGDTSNDQQSVGPQSPAAAAAARCALQHTLQQEVQQLIAEQEAGMELRPPSVLLLLLHYSSIASGNPGLLPVGTSSTSSTSRDSSNGGGNTQDRRNSPTPSCTQVQRTLAQLQEQLRMDAVGPALQRSLSLGALPDIPSNACAVRSLVRLWEERTCQLLEPSGITPRRTASGGGGGSLSRHNSAGGSSTASGSSGNSTFGTSPAAAPQLAGQNSLDQQGSGERVKIDVAAAAALFSHAVLEHASNSGGSGNRRGVGQGVQQWQGSSEQQAALGELMAAAAAQPGVQALMQAFAHAQAATKAVASYAVDWLVEDEEEEEEEVLQRQEGADQQGEEEQQEQEEGEEVEDAEGEEGDDTSSAAGEETEAPAGDAGSPDDDAAQVQQHRPAPRPRGVRAAAQLVGKGIQSAATGSGWLTTGLLMLLPVLNK